MTRTPGLIRIMLTGLTLGAALSPVVAFGHDARPLSITASGQGDGIYRIVVRVPPSIERSNLPVVVWDDACAPLESAPSGRGAGGTSLISCPGGLEGRRVSVDYPFFNPSITTLFRLETRAGYPVTAIMPPDELEWIVPAEPTFSAVARDYLMLGVEHIWSGLDHLLFVAGLLLLARQPRRIVWAVTGFTAAHSITLTLSALALIRVPITLIEAMIALSILFVAAEIARGDQTSFSHRYPIVLSFVFGLLHGFGFASALGEIGLPRAELLAGLLFFNAGVEIGQLAFVAVIATVMYAMRGFGRERAFAYAGAYALGIPAAFWFFGRTAAAFSV